MWQIALLTFTTVASIGPTNLLAIKEGLKSGFRSTFYILFGGVLVDVFYAYLTVFGLSAIVNRFALQKIMTFLGILIFTYLGILGLKNTAQEDFMKKMDQTKKTEKIHPILIGILMTLPNPFIFLVWGTALTNFNVVYDPLYLTGTILSVGFLWSAVEGGMVKFFRDYIFTKTLRFIELLTSLILLGFSVYLLLETLPWF